MARPLRLLSVLVLVLLLAAAGYGGYWWLLARGLRQGIDDWVAQRRGEGWSVAYEALAVDGFPRQLRVTVTAPALARPDGVSWRAAVVTAWASPFAPRLIHLSAPGRHALAARDAAATVEAGELGGLVEIGPEGRPQRAALQLSTIEATLADGSVTRLDRGEADWEALAAPAGGAGTPASAGFRLDAHGLALAPAAARVMAGTVQRLALSGRLLGVLTPGPYPDNLAAWRDAGGAVEVDELRLAWDPVEARGSGTVALDQALQPIGAFTTSVSGFFEVVDRLTAAGLVSTKDGRNAKAVLGLLARTPAGGGKPALTLPLTVQDRQLYAGPLRLLTLPPVRWPGTEGR